MSITDYLNNINLSTNKNIKINEYIGKYPTLFANLNISGAPNKTTRLNLEKQNKVSIKWLNKHSIKRNIEPYKNVTTWYLGCILFEDIPFALLRNTENTEDIYSKVIIINKNVYDYASSYLFEFVQNDPGPELEIYDISGAFSGDVTPHIINSNFKSYDLINDLIYLNNIIEYTEMYNY